MTPCLSVDGLDGENTRIKNIRIVLCLFLGLVQPYSGWKGVGGSRGVVCAFTL